MKTILPARRKAKKKPTTDGPSPPAKTVDPPYTKPLALYNVPIDLHPHVFRSLLSSHHKTPAILVAIRCSRLYQWLYFCLLEMFYKVNVLSISAGNGWAGETSEHIKGRVSSCTLNIK